MRCHGLDQRFLPECTIAEACTGPLPPMCGDPSRDANHSKMSMQVGIIQSCRLAIAKHDRLCCCALAGRGWLGLVCWWSPIMADCRRQRSASTADLVSQLISWCDFWTTCMAAVSWSVVLPHVGINFNQSVPSADGIQCKPVSFIDGRACVCHGCVCVFVWGGVHFAAHNHAIQRRAPVPQVV